MKHKMLRAMALASAVTGASLLASGGASAAKPGWECRDDLPPGSSRWAPRCGYSQFPLQAPDILPELGPAPTPGPSPGPTPYVS